MNHPNILRAFLDYRCSNWGKREYFLCSHRRDNAPYPGGIPEPLHIVSLKAHRRRFHNGHSQQGTFSQRGIGHSIAGSFHHCSETRMNHHETDIRIDWDTNFDLVDKIHPNTGPYHHHKRWESSNRRSSSNIDHRGNAISQHHNLWQAPHANHTPILGVSKT